jgi:hypothetical protein
VVEELGRDLDGLVEVGAAAGEGVAEALQVALRCAPGRLVEHVVELVELDRDRGLAGRHRRAVGEDVLRAPGLQLDVLQSQRRAGPDDDARVDRHGARLLVELEPQPRPDLVVGQHHRRHVGDHADAEAARAHLVALHQVGAVGHEHVELARGHERQAVVGVVGQEDGDDDDERGHRPDEHGAGDDRRVGSAAALHGASR